MTRWESAENGVFLSVKFNLAKSKSDEQLFYSDRERSLKTQYGATESSECLQETETESNSSDGY